MPFGLKAGLGLAAVLALAAGCNRPIPTNPTKGKGVTEDYLAGAREGLSKSGDLPAARNAVQQLNHYLNQLSREKRVELTADQRKLLGERFGLNADELNEVAAGSLTLLDAPYLESCTLFHDAARSLSLNGVPPAERAAAAFAWTMRQVRLRDRQAPVVPARLVIRRGWGSAVERSLVFFALLRQLGLDGCFVTLPGPSQDQPRYWLCGALVAGGARPEVYLFDPRLGLPLPGLKGQGIATLADVRTQPDVLKQLTVDKLDYDVTPEQARTAGVHVAAPLSAFAPRHRLVEDALAPAMSVRLAVEPADLLQRFEAAAAALPEGNRPPVRVARVAVAALREYHPLPEGGVGKTYHLPVDVPAEFWPAFLSVGGEPEVRMRALFQRPFIDFALETRMPREEFFRGRFIYPGKPSSPDQAKRYFDQSGESSAAPGTAAAPGDRRDKLHDSVAEAAARKSTSGPSQTEALERARMPRDLVLHGRLDDATLALVAMDNQLRAQKDRLEKNPNLAKEVFGWRDKMVKAQAAVVLAERGQAALEPARQQAIHVWLEGQQYWFPVLEGYAAVPLLEEVTYQLALCKHERAERLQAQLVRAQRDGKKAPASLADDARNAWRDAAHWWDTIREEHPKRPIADVARRWRARIHEALGDPAAAAALLQDPPPGLGALERLAFAYEARRLKGN